MSLLALQVAGTALSFASTIQSGRAARNQAVFEQEQLAFKAKQDEVVSLERINIRNAQFAANESVNRATFFSGLNRDPSDRSVKAFLAKQKDIAGRDVSTIESQTFIEASQTRLASAAAGARGRAAYYSSLLGAGSAVASGLFRYEEYRTTGSLFKDDK